VITYVLSVLLLVILVGIIQSRRLKAQRQRAAKVQTARLRALRKPVVPLVSASLRGVTTSENPKAS